MQKYDFPEFEFSPYVDGEIIDPDWTGSMGRLVRHFIWSGAKILNLEPT